MQSPSAEPQTPEEVIACLTAWWREIESAQVAMVESLDTIMALCGKSGYELQLLCRSSGRTQELALRQLAGFQTMARAMFVEHQLVAAEKAEALSRMMQAFSTGLQTLQSDKFDFVLDETETDGYVGPALTGDYDEEAQPDDDEDDEDDPNSPDDDDDDSDNEPMTRPGVR